MDDIIWLKPKSSYATISATLTLSGGRRVALVVPTGERACLDDDGVLSALHRRCQLLGKRVVIIGGDARLRALAVAAGFEAATSLDDWGETAPELYAPRTRRRATGAPRLWLVSTQEFQRVTSGEPDAWVSEPPEFVVELRETFAPQSPKSRPSIGAGIARLPEAAEGEITSATERSERFEEVVIGRILETSGIHRPQIPGSL
jgi:hypothetical protein